jgi:hypothetical protein
MDIDIDTDRRLDWNKVARRKREVLQKDGQDDDGVGCPSLDFVSDLLRIN